MQLPDVFGGEHKNASRPLWHELRRSLQNAALHMRDVIALRSFYGKRLHKGVVPRPDARIASLRMDAGFLVIGAGVAGLRAAIELAQAGDVLVVAKDTLRESSSTYAQGGIAVALSED